MITLDSIHDNEQPTLSTILICEVVLFTMSHDETTTQAYLCAIWGFFRICCPNRSVLNMGLRTPVSPLSLPCEVDPNIFGLMDG